VKIAVVGSDGYLGTALCPALERAGHTVSRFDARVWGQELHPGTVEIARDAKVASVRGSDMVIWLAALAHDPTQRIPRGMLMFNNAFQPERTAKLCLESGKRFVAVSSYSVYDKGADGYPSSKRLLEARLSRLGLYKGISIVRFGTLFGVTDDSRVETFRPHLLLNSMMLDAVANGIIRVGAPKTRRPVLSLHQAVSTLMDVVRSADPQEEYHTDPPGTIVSNHLASDTLVNFAHFVQGLVPDSQILCDRPKTPGLDRRDYAFAPSANLRAATLLAHLRQLRTFCEEHTEDLLQLRRTQFTRLYENLGLSEKPAAAGGGR